MHHASHGPALFNLEFAQPRVKDRPAKSVPIALPKLSKSRCFGELLSASQDVTTVVRQRIPGSIHPPPTHAPSRHVWRRRSLQGLARCDRGQC